MRTRSQQADPILAAAYFLRGKALAAGGRNAAAITDLNEAVRLWPRLAAAYVELGRLNALAGDHELAADDYRTALHLDPSLAAAHGEQMARTFNTAGEAYREEGDLDRALRCYHEALRLHPAYAPAYRNRGITHRERDSLPEAIADFTEAIRLEPQYALAHSNRGWAYRLLGEYDRALADYDEAIRLEPRDAGHHNNRGVVHRDRGDLARALEDFNTALRMDPNLDAAYLNRAGLLRLRGDYEQLLNDLAAVQQRQPQDARAATELAWFLATCPEDRYRNGKRAALVALQACAATAWRDVAALEALAAGLAEYGDFRQAATRQLQALQLAGEKQTPAMRKRLELYRAGRPFHEARP
jgi:tetratricopeptide (TPR) repeat protein